MSPVAFVSDRFETERVAGRGGMGVVYRARDRLTGGTVALKVGATSSGDDVARFQREAEVLAELRHPAIVRYIAHGETPAGERYLAMEWLEGESLSERLKRAPLGPDESVDLATRVAEGLAAAHARGIVHRDLKPQNLFLPGGDPERVKIIDFGIARRRVRELTMTGAALGTPGYMAPEQARGDRDIDARADVFALGCVLFRSVAGRAPFTGDDALAVILKVVLEEAPALSSLVPGISPDLDALVVRLLAKRREERPPHGAAVARLLRAVRSESLHGPPSYEPAPALGSDEQRVIAVVVARAAPRGDDDATVSTSIDAAVGRAVASAVTPHQGELSRLADGTVVVTVSTAEPALDLAARGARCALAVRALLPDLPMALAVGQGRAGERVPMGDAIDRAVRSLSPAPAVRLDEAAAGLLDVRFAILRDPHGLALGSERDDAAPRTLLGKPTPCVGRDRELGSLTAAFDECAGEPLAQAVLVTALAGLGKTRLRVELTRRLAASEAPPTVLAAQGDPLGGDAPFALLGAILRRDAGVIDGEPEAARVEKLRARVARWVPAGDRARVARFLGELAAIPFPDDDPELQAARADPRILGDQMRRAFEDFLRAECAARPVVIAIDDLHHGDLPSVSFLDGALRALPEKPLLVLALARPEVRERFPDLWSGRRVERMELQPLGRRSAERLVRQVLPDLDAATVTQVVARAGGNAYYLEELIRAVAAGRRDDLPGTIVAMTQARLSALDPEARRVLRAASVFGNVFWRRGVAALLGGERRTMDLGDWIDALVSAELVTRRPGSRFPTEEELAFRDAPLRDAAYAMLTTEDRALGHRLAAEWLEAAGCTEPVALAEHFARGDRPARAVGHFARAAEQALAGGDLGAALALSERGIAGGATGRELGELRLIQAEAHAWRGDNADSERCGTEAMSASPRGSRAYFHAVAELCTASGRLAHTEILAEVATGLLAPDLASGDRRAHLVALARAALQAIQTGQVELGDRLLARASELVVPTPGSTPPDPAVRGWILRARATAALYRGDLGAGLAFTTRSVAEFDAAGDRRAASIQRINVGYLRLELGQYADAVSALREALAAALALGMENHANVAKNNLGLALCRTGAVDEGRRVEEEAIAVFEAQGEKRLSGGSRVYLALILMAAGDLAGAEREARVAAVICASIPTALPGALATLAAVLIARGASAEAAVAAREAKRAMDLAGSIEEGESLVRLSYAEALDAVGEHDAARAAFAEARARLLARADRIQEPDVRATFLSAVPENARTLALSK